MTDLEAAWEAQQPPPSFAERVVAAAVREQRSRNRRIALAGVVAVVGVAAAAAVLIKSSAAPPSQGDVVAQARIEVPIGARAVAVLEPGARITWNGNVVEQSRGDVFYRVEPGTQFEVRTPASDAAVLGTCFRITVEEKGKAMKKRDFGAGTVGAIVGIVVVVGVYEGQVRVSHGKEAVIVGAGERAVAESNGVRAEGVRTLAAAKDDAAARTTVELRERLSALENEKAALEKELVAAHDGIPKKSPYDLSPDDWAKLAEEGRFTYQLPCMEKGGYRPSAEKLAKLGLEPAEADVIQRAYQNAKDRFAAEASAICEQMPGAQDLNGCLTSLFTDLYKDGKAQKAFTEVAQIRAGKHAMPADASPQLRLLMTFSGQMQPFEDELAQTFGADEAHRLAYSDELCYQSNTMR